MKVGILGGGQLALYLCEAARRLGIETLVLAHNGDSPAAVSAGRLIRGSLGDLKLVQDLISEVDVLTFEVEAVPPETLKFLAAAMDQGQCEVHPHPSTMLVLQDKLLQKRWLRKNGLPTNPWFPLETGQSVTGDRPPFDFPLVQKTRSGGYDGKGVQVIREPAGLPGLWPVPSLLEPFLDSVREYAVVAVRDRAGRVVCYEPVALEFDGDGNVLSTVVAPAGLPERLNRLALAITKRAVSRLHGAGVFAVELFLTGNGEMLINEISPRVHNSGHHTMESCETSQFEQHMRAVAGLSIGSVRQRNPAVMINLLSNGTDRTSGEGLSALLPGDESNIRLHWYGKKEHRPFRKMGHLTAVGPTPETARRHAEASLAEYQQTREAS
jgi:5-(carboxyamino)imidazole ribonucleotide synthase